MGLIKTAVYSGAGMYAINKIAKAPENHHNGNEQQHLQNDNQRDAYYPPQCHPNQQQWYGQGYPQGPYEQNQRYVRPEDQIPLSYYQDNARGMIQDEKQNSSSGVIREVVEPAESSSAKGRGY